MMEITCCRACASVDMEEIVDLGPCSPNEFPKDRPTRPKIPLELVRCAKCTLVQLAHTTPPDWLFRNYWYRSGINETMVAELRTVAERALDRITLERHDTIVDIGCNDGTLFLQFRDLLGPAHPRLIGFEPALNLADEAERHCDLLIRDYFSEQVAATELHLSAKVVTSIAMFYTLDDPNRFVHAVKHILHPDGVWIIQFQDLLRMLQTGAFDNICHEHLEYYTLYSLQRLLATNDLIVEDVEPVAINGGSLRCYVRHKHRRVKPASEGPIRVLAQLMREQDAGLHGRIGISQLFPTFEHKITRTTEQVQSTLEALANKSVIVDGYGASTKFNIFSEVCAIGPHQIRQIAERSSEKWGRVTTTRIPIVSEEHWRNNPAPATLIGPWQFRDAFLKREALYLQNGGAFLFGLPEVEWVTH